MCPREGSLRCLVDKWLPPRSGASIRITRLLLAGTQVRYIRLEAQRAEEHAMMFFFRHDDGNWRVFPPQTTRPMMNAHRMAA